MNKICCDVCSKVLRDYETRLPLVEIEITPHDKDGFIISGGVGIVHICETCFYEKILPLLPAYKKTHSIK